MEKQTICEEIDRCKNKLRHFRTFFAGPDMIVYTLITKYNQHDGLLYMIKVIEETSHATAARLSAE